MDKSRIRYLSKELKSLSHNRVINILIILLGISISVSTIIQIAIISLIVSSFFDNEYHIPIYLYFILIFTFILKATFIYIKDKLGFFLGSNLRKILRKMVLDRINDLGPQNISNNHTSLAEIFFDQIESCHMYVARYIPQTILSVVQPLCILIVVLYFNWLAGLILLITAPILPIFMILIGIKTSEINQKQLYTLLHLENQFFDKIKGLTTIISFNKQLESLYNLIVNGKEYHLKTMKLLKIAFLNSAVLEFFTSISIALMAIYFGFSYMKEINFGSYEYPISLFIGFLCLTLAAEFYQPIRDLGTYYHDKSSALNAIDYIYKFIKENSNKNIELNNQKLYKYQNKKQHFIKDNYNRAFKGNINIFENTNCIQFDIENLEIFSESDIKIAGPYNISFNSKDKVLLYGKSGSGKTSLMLAILGLYPYKGSIRINNIELTDISRDSFTNSVSILSQNPVLENKSIIDNILIANKNASKSDINSIIETTYIDQLIKDKGLDFIIGDNIQGLSGGQIQRISLARSLIKDSKYIFLDEPTSNLDKNTELNIIKSIKNITNKGVFIISHSDSFINDDCFIKYKVTKDSITRV